MATESENETPAVPTAKHRADSARRVGPGHWCRPGAPAFSPGVKTARARRALRSRGAP
jgi:hypothetical protein